MVASLRLISDPAGSRTIQGGSRSSHCTGRTKYPNSVCHAQVAKKQDKEDDMTDRETIIAAYRFTQMYAEKLAADLTDEELTTQPHAGMNHAAWVLGHVA